MHESPYALPGPGAISREDFRESHFLDFVYQLTRGKFNIPVHNFNWYNIFFVMVETTKSYSPSAKTRNDIILCRIHAFIGMDYPAPQPVYELDL
jgi:hypothetical protein